MELNSTNSPRACLRRIRESAKKKKYHEHCLVLKVQAFKERKSGGDSNEDPPVPIPNTEVKLINVDGTWRATSRESRKMPDLNILP